MKIVHMAERAGLIERIDLDVKRIPSAFWQERVRILTSGALAFSCAYVLHRGSSAWHAGVGFNCIVAATFEALMSQAPVVFLTAAIRSSLHLYDERS